jgi:putative transposase
LCRLLKVGRSGFYGWLSRPVSARALADEVLTDQVRVAFDSNRRATAARGSTPAREEGVHVGRKRIAG